MSPRVSVVVPVYNEGEAINDFRARNPGAMEVCAAFNETAKGFSHVTLPYLVKDGLLEKLV